MNNTTIPNSLYGRGISSTSSDPFVLEFSNRSPTVYDIGFPVQKEWLNILTNTLWLLKGFTTSQGVTTANWIQLGGPMGFISEITGNIGGPVGPAPVTNNVNIIGDGTTISVAGNPSTNTLTISSLGASTTYTENTGTASPVSGNLNVLGASGIVTIGSGDTILIETTADVATSFVANTGTAIPFSNALTVVGAGGITTSGSGSTLTITGLPPGFTSINNQVFTTSGTYTPTVGMTYCNIQCLAGGGAGGGTPITGPAQYAAAPGGGAGEYAVGIFSAAIMGASRAVVIGAGGTGVAGAAGGTGGATSVTAVITAIGGFGGQAGAAGNSTAYPGTPGGSGGTGGDYRSQGFTGESSTMIAVLSGPTISSGFASGGSGANSQLGGGGLWNFPGDGLPGTGYGSGGGGAAASTSATAQSGGDGSPGIVIITEYIG